MAIQAPREPVYYYECSAGDFRLVYFVPPAEIERLHAAGEINADAVRDYPDGLDLGCTEPDFAEFEEAYGYRPSISPDAARQAFFAIFSTTLDWEGFRGSGFVPAQDLESRIEIVGAALDAQEDVEMAAASRDEPPALKQRKMMKQRVAKQLQVRTTLRELPIEGVDQRKTMREQKFTEIQWSAGDPAPEVFEKLHRKHSR